MMLMSASPILLVIGFASTLLGGAGTIPTLRAGETVNGRLDAHLPTLDDGSHYAEYIVRGRPGERVIITMRSSTFDAYLIGGPMIGDDLDPEDFDDDGAGGTDALLYAVLGHDGTYGVWANSYDAGETGTFTISVDLDTGDAGADRLVGRVGTVRTGSTVSAVFRSHDPTLGDGSHFHMWIFEGEPGEELVITMRSVDVDTYLGWGTVRGGRFTEEHEDDDGAGGTDSRLRVRVGASGTFAIRANTYDGGELGEYTLSVARAGAELPTCGCRTIL
jgi:hypothetical protein